MEDTLVGFEVAKLAKGKGFSIVTQYGFCPDGEELSSAWKYMSNDNRSISRPTQSLLQRWLREVHNIYVDVVSYYDEDQLPLSKDNLQKPKGFFCWDAYDEGFSEEKADKFKTYEQALEHRVMEGLNLIKKQIN